MSSEPALGLSDEDIRAAYRLALRALRDLQLPQGFAASDAAGLYHTVFGRDSLWICLLLLQAEQMTGSAEFRGWVCDAVGRCLTGLAGSQGSGHNDEVEEQPGRIIHEVHDEPTAHAIASGLPLDARGRSFAGFDQTFLFITAVYQYALRFPADARVATLWPHVERAVDWVDSYADEDGDGLYEYTRRGPRNLVHQVWKDSFDAITHVGFDVPAPPIAWIDVQGYAYRALCDAADLYQARGVAGRAAALRDRAEALRVRVNEVFWMPGERCFAVALDGAKRLVRMVTSNPGHALWSGIVDAELAGPLIERLLQADLATEYGVRTLASSSSFYAPFAYHRGSIWPHDNAVLVAGLLRYGETGRAHELMAAVTSALQAIGTPIELYVALDTEAMVDTGIRPQQPRILMTRTAHRLNAVQGFSAAAQLMFAAALARERGIDAGAE
jgi:glycogen debranching enzyme